MKIGDWVSVLDDDLKGKIFTFNAQWVQIEDEHGFLHEIEKTKITPYQESIYEKIPLIFTKEEARKNAKKKHNNETSIDLHFEKLVNDPQQFPAWERQMIQREKLIEKLEFCKENQIKKLNIIHGIGDGVLQNMVHDILRGFSGIEYDDHDFFYHSSGNILVTFV